MRDHVFLSYRRGDTQDFAARLDDRLRALRYPVFRDVSDIAPGADFPLRLDEALSRCRVLIAVIGDEWLTARNENGQRRIDDPGDWVQREISQALKRNIRVIPVLVDDAPMPRAEDLPPALRALADRNAVRITDAYFADGVRKLAKGIGAPIHWIRWVLCAAAMLVFTLGALAAATPRTLSRATVRGAALELTGVTVAETLFDFQQPAKAQIHVNSEFSRARLLPRSARILGIGARPFDKLEILTARLDRPGSLCRTSLSARPTAGDLDLRITSERGPIATLKLHVVRGGLQVSQHTVAADSSRPAQPGCDKELRVGGQSVRMRQIPVDVVVDAPGEIVLQFRDEAATATNELFPRFAPSGVTCRRVRRVTAGGADREWRSAGAQRMEVVEVGIRNGAVEAAVEGRITETGMGGVKWLLPLLVIGNGLLALIGWRYNGLPVLGWH